MALALVWWSCRSHSSSRRKAAVADGAQSRLRRECCFDTKALGSDPHWADDGEDSDSDFVPGSSDSDSESEDEG